MAIAWDTPSEISLISLFPEIICVDTVKDTNTEGKPVLTISINNNNGKLFTILQFFFQMNNPGYVDGYFLWFYHIF